MALSWGGRTRRILLILATVAVAGALAGLFGWDVLDWIGDLWDTISTIEIEYVVAGVIATTVKTTATAYAWYWILRYAYPGEIRFRVIRAAYAVCVALNSILPANLGTIVMFVMLTSVIASATFAGLVGAFVVQKIFFTIASVFVFAYLFVTVQLGLGHPRRGRREPGDERRGARRRHGRGNGHRVFGLPAARDHRLGDPPRDRAHGLGVRLGRRQDACRGVVRGGEATSCRAESGQGGGEARRGTAGRRLITARLRRSGGEDDLA
jgi:hypothetical protein